MIMINESRRFGGPVTLVVIYAVSILLVVFAWFWHRAAQVDPQLVQRRKHIYQQVQEISSARRLPPQEAAAQVATALRQITAQVGQQHHPRDIDRIIARCDVLAYAPQTDSQPLDSTLHQQAENLARAIVNEHD